MTDRSSNRRNIIIKYDNEFTQPWPHVNKHWTTYTDVTAMNEPPTQTWPPWMKLLLNHLHRRDRHEWNYCDHKRWPLESLAPPISKDCIGNGNSSFPFFHGNPAEMGIDTMHGSENGNRTLLHENERKSLSIKIQKPFLQTSTLFCCRVANWPSLKLCSKLCYYYYYEPKIG